MPKAIFLDIDGTLLSFATRQVPQTALSAMSKAKQDGVKIFIATGRHKNELGADPNLTNFPFDGYVTQNGAYCYTREKTVHAVPLKKRTVEFLVELIKKDPFTCIFCMEDEMFLNSANDHILELLNSFKLPVPPICDISRALVSDIYQVVPIVSIENEKILYTLPGAKVTKWYSGGYDIINENVNKWLGIEKMIDYFGIKREDVAAIGDAENDIEMLVNAGYSVAMGNASDDVKKCAKFVTTHVDEDGIKNAFDYLLGGKT